MRRVRGASPQLITIAARLGDESLTTGDEWVRYEREFERYLARWAMELSPDATLAMLETAEGRALPLENRALATLSLGGKRAAVGVARLAPELNRPLGSEEVRALVTDFEDAAVKPVLTQALGAPRAAHQF